MWWLIMLLSVATLMLGIINATRIETIKTDVSSIDTSPPPKTDDTIMVSSSSGVKMPKKLYWLKVKPATSQDGKQKLDLEDDPSTDYDSFRTDIMSGRTTHLYTPKQRRLFTIDKATYMTTPVSGSGMLVPASLSQATHMTMIGLPMSTINNSG
ncbi:hypothetical protein TetV_481 [Tetraselmis virus 1]|uniref:Uncharacterized protein n=1 Tax=Tetraselmis virus 1 TaxID=2060617 RepID=A0A2P0VNT7_9VIRU|nr:hypothetical protein QJ968_gp573 [Tetraselmis virus 1]AUF82563.1 hypothetical protein TetV_481 [Tetraselmis virus 1]